jgi:hypothetical protein
LFIRRFSLQPRPRDDGTGIFGNKNAIALFELFRQQSVKNVLKSDDEWLSGPLSHDPVLS